MNIDISPTVFNTSSTITKITINVVEMKLYEHIIISILYSDANGAYIYHPSLVSVMKIEKEEYALWGQDDSYITQQVIQKLGLALPPPPTLPE
jgi:hypothetical protein